MTSLADLLDPDQWIVSGKNLTDFPWADSKDEREAMTLILSTRPLLKAHMERWSRKVMDALGRRGREKVGDVFCGRMSPGFVGAIPRLVLKCH